MPVGTGGPKKFKRTMWRAIITTNLVGMPALILFIGAVLNITLGNLHRNILMDPVFFIWNVGLIGVIASIFIWLHFMMVMRFAKPVTEYLELSAESKDKLKTEVVHASIKSCLDVPFKTMIWSVILYLFGITGLLIIINIFYTFSYTQIFILFVGSFATGVLISFFQFFTSKRVLIHILEDILSDFPEFTLYESLNHEKNSIGAKILVAIIILSGVVVTLTGTLAYVYAVHSYQTLTGMQFKIKVNKQESTIKSCAYGAEPCLLSLFENFKIFDKDKVIITDNKGNYLQGSEYSPRLKEVFERIITGTPFKLARNRPIISIIQNSGVYSVILSRNTRLTVTHHALDDLNLFFISSTGEFKNQLRILWLFILIAIAATLLIAIAYAYFATEEIKIPLRSIAGSIQRVAEGDLREPVRVISQDEIGVLALNQATMVVNLQKMIGRINEASSGIDNATGHIADRSVPMFEGSAEQLRNSEETAAAMEEMNQSIKMIADNTETLARSAEESSASILQMGATIDEVADNVDKLSTAVEQTTSSIQEMNLSIKEVADNAQKLRQRSGESMVALQEVENTIWSVGASAQETARLSEQMANDAEQGERSVAMTASGIEKIRASSEDAATVIDALSRQAGRIGNILDVINDVTEETNLLALNAAIIAAQAGEHGRGFAVVADEIKDLAERTQSSTREISELIQSVQEGAQNAVATVFKGSKNVEEGVKLSEEARAALEQILGSAKQTTKRTREIAESTALQSEKAKHVMNFFEGVNDLISQVAQATQEQSRGSDLIFRAAQEMESISKHVKRATKEQSQGSKQITQSIENIAQIVNFINTAQSEQIKSSHAVTQAMLEIKNVAEKNSMRVNEMNVAMDNLKFLARDLKEMIQSFKLRTDSD